MIIGMVPMSLGLGEGGEQNAPLGRAVIGGLLVATFRNPVFCALRVFPGSRTQRRCSDIGKRPCCHPEASRAR